MLDKKSYKLLKALYKSNSLTYDEIDRVLNVKTPNSKINEYALNLSRYKLINLHFLGYDELGNSLHDGYEINLEGRGYVENQRRQFLGFLLPYTITTFIALLSLVTTIMTNYDKFLHALSKIAEILPLS